MRILEITPVFCDNIPEEIIEGMIYINEKYHTAVHLCACGCGQKTVTPLGVGFGPRWTLIKDDGIISLRPSIGNFNGEKPYHAHYFITKNKIHWC